MKQTSRIYHQFLGLKMKKVFKYKHRNSENQIKNLRHPTQADKKINKTIKMLQVTRMIVYYLRTDFKKWLHLLLLLVKTA